MDHRHHAAGHTDAPPTFRSKVADAVNAALGTSTADDSDGTALHTMRPGEASTFQRAMLLQLQRPKGMFSREANIYTGSVPADVVAQRRAKNKRARKARRINRIHNAA